VFVPDSAPLTDRLKANVLRRSTGVDYDQVTRVRADRVRRRRGAFTSYSPSAATTTSASSRAAPRSRRQNGFWYIEHATVTGLYNLDTERSSSNAVGLALEWLHADHSEPRKRRTSYQTRAPGLVAAANKPNLVANCNRFDRFERR
jgi:hypothetical protein